MMKQEMTPFQVQALPTHFPDEWVFRGGGFRAPVRATTPSGGSSGRCVRSRVRARVTCVAACSHTPATRVQGVTVAWRHGGGRRRAAGGVPQPHGRGEQQRPRAPGRQDRGSDGAAWRRARRAARDGAGIRGRGGGRVDGRARRVRR